MKDKPWWYPEVTDLEWAKRIREDHPEHVGYGLATLREAYADGRRYANAQTWDHVGDAYEEYEALADAYLDLKSRVDEIEKYCASVAESVPQEGHEEFVTGRSAAANVVLSFIKREIPNKEQGDATDRMEGAAPVVAESEAEEA